jgi:L-arabinokinase
VKDYPAFYPHLQKIREQYQSADFLIELRPSNGMPYFGNRVKVSLLGRNGRCIRDSLKNKLGLAREKHMGLIYVGEFGMNCVSWKNLEKFNDWEFIGIYPLPGEPANYHCVRKEDFLYQDLVASVEVLVSKIGYGVFSECQINGTPLIYLPRKDFAEYPVLEKVLVEWGHGFCLTQDDFCSLNWEKVLSEVVLRKKPEPQPSDASRICAREIEGVVRSGRSRP